MEPPHKSYLQAGNWGLCTPVVSVTRKAEAGGLQVVGLPRLSYGDLSQNKIQTKRAEGMASSGRAHDCEFNSQCQEKKTNPPIIF
jgi:hypothetical protein